jgi:hypothetical protein
MRTHPGLVGLAISLETLADYVGEAAPTAGTYCVSITASTHSSYANPSPHTVFTVFLAGLAINLETITDYVGEVAPAAGSDWVSPTASTHSCYV